MPLPRRSKALWVCKSKLVGLEGSRIIKLELLIAIYSPQACLEDCTLTVGQ